MKRWIKYALIGLAMLVLVACQSANESTTTLAIEEDGLMIEITLIADGDTVIEQRTNNEISYEALGVTSEEDAEEMLAEFMVGYDTTEGITHQVDYQDTRVIETVVVDFETVDVDEVLEDCINLIS